MIANPCKSCSGTGVVQKQTKLKVAIPGGVDHGQTLRVPGKGQAGSKGGPAGNLYVVVRVEADERFVRDEFDIHTKIDISLIQAVLGGVVNIPTLEGEEELEIAPGTQPGDIVVRRGQGIPVLGGRGRGDQHIHIQVQIPKKLTNEQQEIMHALAESFGESVTGSRKGFVDRLLGRK